MLNGVLSIFFAQILVAKILFNYFFVTDVCAATALRNLQKWGMQVYYLWKKRYEPSTGPKSKYTCQIVWAFNHFPLLLLGPNPFGNKDVTHPCMRNKPYIEFPGRKTFTVLTDEGNLNSWNQNGHPITIGH